MDSENLIGTLRLELSFPPKGKDDNHSRRLDALSDDVIVPVLERVIDEYGVRNIDIESMEIDLGNVSEKDLPEVLEREFRARLDAFVVPDPFLFTKEDGIESHHVISTDKRPAHPITHLTHYLETLSPPWTEQPSDFNPIDLLSPLYVDLASGESFIRSLDIQSAARLAVLLEYALNSKEPLSSNIGAAGLKSDTFVPESSVTEVLTALRDRTLEQVRTQDMEIASRLIISRNRWLSYLSVRSARYGSGSGDPVIENVRTPELAGSDSRSVESPETVKEAVSRLSPVRHEIDDETISPGTLLESRSSVGADDHPDTSDDRSSLQPDTSSTVEGIIPARPVKLDGAAEAEEEVERRISVGSDLISGQAAEAEISSAAEETAEEDILIDFSDRLGKGLAFGNPEPYWSEEGHETVRVPLSDAGLVLIHPFIPRFLHNLGLTDGKGRFISGISRVHAVHLLREITGFDTPHFDHNLLLEKLLCGLSMDSLLPLDWDSDDKEKQEIQDLLEAVRSYWPSLANSSNLALQRAFLQRSGSVEPLEDSFLVRVESSAMDILLDDLTWENSIIVLPWLDNPIIVEWQR